MFRQSIYQQARRLADRSFSEGRLMETLGKGSDRGPSMGARDQTKQSPKTAFNNYVAIIIFRLFPSLRLKRTNQQTRNF